MSAPKVFISYSHDDSEWVRTFAEALRSQGLDVWLDAWRLHPGDSMIEALEAGLRDADAIVAVLSESNVRRPNTLFELGVALGSGKRLIPVVSSELNKATIPYELRNRRYLEKAAPTDVAREVAEALKSDTALASGA